MIKEEEKEIQDQNQEKEKGSRGYEEKKRWRQM